MQAAEVCPDVMGRAEIVLAEVLNNITEHACRDGVAVWIDLCCDLTEAGLRIVVTDQDPPLPRHLMHPSPQPAAAPCDLGLPDLPEEFTPGGDVFAGKRIAGVGNRRAHGLQQGAALAGQPWRILSQLR